MANLAPIAEGIWTDEPQPRLIGAKHRTSNEIIFPMPSGELGEQYEEIPLSRNGIIWSWTIQGFRPKTPPYSGPEEFKPFALGYVELPNEVIVETRFTQTDNLSVGMPVELTIIDGGDGRAIYAFQPMEQI